VSPSNFHQVLLSALRNHQADAERKGQMFRIDLEETETLALLDYARMTEVLDNLLSNAVKYAPKGAEIEARTRFQEEYNLLEFSLYNPGVGLSEEDKSRIFQKFSKLSAKPTGGEGSTGLGLSIVRALTEMHGGNIRAESDGIDQGVRFILQIPVSRVA
jgi:signal transduction histidine kinase